MKKTEFNAYVVIHGLLTANKTAVDYVAGIVYGNPKVEAVVVGSRFVAIVHYPLFDGGKGQPAPNVAVAQHTHDRMGSFPYGSSIHFDEQKAEAEFGRWVRHYAPGTIVGN